MVMKESTRTLVFYMRLILCVSIATFYMQSLMVGQRQQPPRQYPQQYRQVSFRTPKVKRNQFIYSESAKFSKYDAVPIYAQRVEETKDERDLASKVISYKQFGKATSIATFQSTFPSYHVLHLTKKKIQIFQHTKIIQTDFNGNITIHNRNNGSYFTASKNRIYILSAFLRRNMPRNKLLNTYYGYESASGSDITFTGWIQEMATNATLLCCLFHSDNTVIFYENMKRLIWTQVKKQELLAGKVFCPIPFDIVTSNVIGATLSLDTDKCVSDTYMDIVKLKHVPKNSVGICSKIVYGDLEAGRVLEWIEIQKYIQVDKIVLYVYNLNSKTVEVLRHYADEGFLDLVPFDYPLAEDLVRYVGEKEAMAYIDEQVVVFDCMERLRGFTYTAIMDVDEILYAKNENNSVKILMAQLMKKFPKAGGFTFMTELFITDWPTEGQADAGMFWHTLHQNRTEALRDRPKNILKLDRVVPGSVWTHNYTTIGSFTRHVVPTNLAVVKHYRPCRENWGCHERKGHIDKSIVDIVINIAETIVNAFSVLGIDYE